MPETKPVRRRINAYGKTDKRYQMPFWGSKAEHQAVKVGAKQAGMSISAYLSACLKAAGAL